MDRSKKVSDSLNSQTTVYGFSDARIHHVCTRSIPALIIGFDETEIAVSDAPFKGCLSTIASQ